MCEPPPRVLLQEGTTALHGCPWEEGTRRMPPSPSMHICWGLCLHFFAHVSLSTCMRAWAYACIKCVYARTFAYMHRCVHAHFCTRAYVSGCVQADFCKRVPGILMQWCVHTHVDKGEVCLCMQPCACALSMQGLFALQSVRWCLRVSARGCAAVGTHTLKEVQANPFHADP